MRICALLLAVAAAVFCQDNQGVLPEGPGVASRYAGDAGIAEHPAVVFVEDFRSGVLEELRARWSEISNRQDRVMAFEKDVPPGSASPWSLRMTATRTVNDGGHLYRNFEPGHDQLFLRFYVKFAPDAGFNHHFVSLGGEINPAKHAVGRAGRRPVDRWNSGIEPVSSSQHAPGKQFGPPGIWHFYTYWPEMRSWQSEDGKATDDNGRAFYGNNFEPKEPVAAPRGQWICVEMMVKMNSTPESYDGEEAMWIDGKLAARFAKGTMRGKWSRALFRVDPAGEPFEGFRWRTNPEVKINKLWLSHYASNDQAFPRTLKYAAAHPEVKIDTDRQTVWFAHVVAAKEYIGPLGKAAPARGRKQP
jgi:hypothetical protein